MRKTKLFKHIEIARARVAREITGYSESGGKYARGLAGEGYNGGYRDALDDVVNLLNDVVPLRNGWWFDNY